jgi:hypothetical protein
MEEIAMKKPKTVANLLMVADICIEAFETGLDFWSLVARGYQKEGMIGRSTPQNEEIRRTMEDTAIAENNPQIRKKEDPSDAPTVQRSVKSIAPRDMIWKNAKLFWITKRCRLQQCRHPKIPVGESIAGRSPMETSIWQKST